MDKKAESILEAVAYGTYHENMFPFILYLYSFSVFSDKY